MKRWIKFAGIVQACALCSCSGLGGPSDDDVVNAINEYLIENGLSIYLPANGNICENIDVVERVDLNEIRPSRPDEFQAAISAGMVPIRSSSQTDGVDEMLISGLIEVDKVYGKKSMSYDKYYKIFGQDRITDYGEIAFIDKRKEEKFVKITEDSGDYFCYGFPQVGELQNWSVAGEGSGEGIAVFTIRPMLHPDFAASDIFRTLFDRDSYRNAMNGKTMTVKLIVSDRKVTVLRDPNFTTNSWN